MTTLIEAIRNKANGTYRFRGDAAKTIAALGDKQPRHLRFKGLAGKKQFIEALGQALEFPDYSAKNWDAFEESLSEINIGSPHGLLIELDGLSEFATKHSDDLETALAILADAANEWQSRNTGLWILVDGAGAIASDLPALTA